MFLAGEMLIMIIMSNPMGSIPKSPKLNLALLAVLTFPLWEVFLFENKVLTLSTLLTFPLPEAFFSKIRMQHY